ncbi:hypothetical protein TNCV_229741 [Trichonephila clavipes]|nr:hypothetical protein TNCV_229741 [Trichonephila clavipes]
MIKSIRTLSLPVPTRSENFNLFFQSLERAFLTKKINDEYKSEILINLLGERAHNVLLYISDSPLVSMKKEEVPLRTAYSQDSRIKAVSTPSHDKTSPVSASIRSQCVVRSRGSRKFAGVEVKVLVWEAG